MKMDKRIVMGVEVKDLTVDVTATIVYDALDISGNKRFGLQSKSPDGKAIPDPIEADPHLLEFVSNGLKDRVTPPAVKKPKFALGSIVRERASGIEGMVTKWVLHINGCRWYFVNPPKKSTMTDNIPEKFYVNEEMLEKVPARPAIKRFGDIKAKVVPEGTTGPGGPISQGVRPY